MKVIRVTSGQKTLDWLTLAKSLGALKLNIEPVRGAMLVYLRSDDEETYLFVGQLIAALGYASDAQNQLPVYDPSMHGQLQVYLQSLEEEPAFVDVVRALSDVYVGLKCTPGSGCFWIYLKDKSTKTLTRAVNVICGFGYETGNDELKLFGLTT